jgi:hypothetical protein
MKTVAKRALINEMSYKFNPAFCADSAIMLLISREISLLHD